MADLTSQERLQPSLLDRITDERPEDRQESRERRVMSLRQLRSAVLRDLAWLLNASSRFDEADAEEFPHVARSVIAFGVPDLCGQTRSSLDIGALEAAVREAIVRFEPRIIPHSLRVTAHGSIDETNRNSLSFEIHGELWAQPVPEPLFLRTDIDLETGASRVEDRPNG
ncbi:MAG: type VI secretion system baseplate subunit TssE [Phycisphaerae bacterium]|nr:type VI secretion system baseplate subunit TssE [Phycisphaerae bacterium]